MTLKQKLDEFNELKSKGRLEVYYESDQHAYVYTVKDGLVYFEGSKCYPPYDTIENRAKIINHQKKLIKFIMGALKSINIEATDLEDNYDVLTFDKSYMVLCKHEGNEYTFIEYTGELFGLYAVHLSMTKLNLDTNDLTFDRINFNEQKHYHAEKHGY